MLVGIAVETIVWSSALSRNTIISAQSASIRTKEVQDLAAQVSRIEEEVLVGARNLVRLRNTLDRKSVV